MQHQGSAVKLVLVLLALADVSDALTHHADGSALKHPSAPTALPSAKQALPSAKHPSLRPQAARQREAPASEPLWELGGISQLLVVTTILVLVSLLIAVAAWWSTCGRGTGPYVVEEPLESQGLCRWQIAAAWLSLLSTACPFDPYAGLLPPFVPAAGLVADTGIHACVLLRILLVFVDGQHTTALRSYMNGVSRWSLWFDARANSGPLQAATLWVALSFALLLFALTALGGVQLGSVARLRNEWHVLLSYLILIPGLLLRTGGVEPRSAVPRLALVLNGMSSVWALVGGPPAASLSFAACLLLTEAWTAHRPRAAEGALACTYNLTSIDFEEHLATE